MPTDTITPTLVINKLTKAQYEGIVNPSDTELYLVPDDDPSTPIYRGSYNIVTDLGLTTTSSQSDIIIALENEISTPQYANYCFVDIPYANYSVVSGYDQFTTTSDYVGYYVLVGDVYTLVTADNNDTLGIIVGTTVAYSVSYTSYFEKIQRYRYNGNSWVYEYDTDFSGCANVDADNFTSEGETYLSKIGYMDLSRIESLTIPASGSVITAPANGWFWGNISFTSAVAIVMFGTIDNNDLRIGSYVTTGNNRISNALLPVREGDQFYIYWSSNGSNKKLCFIYAEGTPTPPTP